jgi:hypothetical protein
VPGDADQVNDVELAAPRKLRRLPELQAGERALEVFHRQFPQRGRTRMPVTRREQRYYCSGRDSVVSAILVACIGVIARGVADRSLQVPIEEAAELSALIEQG